MDSREFVRKFNELRDSGINMKKLEFLRRYYRQIVFENVQPVILEKGVILDAQG